MKATNENEANTYHITTIEGDIDITEPRERIFSGLATEIRAGMNQKLNGVMPDKMIFTGGGAKVLTKYIKEWNEHAIILENAQMAQSEGFYRYAKFLQQEE
jgi:hypothetical protein